ncbi:MAG TPA: hypothetical protein VJX70_11915 [Candidatus Acidoferrum sp.]|nr:hypothetical protein [Candidatus Acidoferrum sp.]
MKRLFLAVCCVLALSTLGPVSAASAHGWPFHRHHKDAAAADASHAAKPKKAKSHREKSSDKAREKAARKEVVAGVSPGPKSVGWRHQTPGPAGAGAN